VEDQVVAQNYEIGGRCVLEVFGEDISKVMAA
jgi:hypothetical protein